MRRPRAGKLTHSPLRTLIAAAPVEALRELVLELMLNGATPGTVPTADAPAEDPPPARRAAKRRGRRPPGKRRGRPCKAVDATVDRKLLARRQKAVAYQRAKRAAAKQAKAEQAPAETSYGKAPAKVSAAALWEHAELLAPKTPWRAVAKEFGANEARMLDCYRARGLPPGVAVNAIERFLGLAPTA